MVQKLPDLVVKTIIKSLQEGTLIQKQARLCDLAALDFIPTEILPHLKLRHQKAIAKSPVTSRRIIFDFASSKERKVKFEILRNQNIYSEIFEILSKDNDVEIHRLISTHTKTPGEILIECEAKYPHIYSRRYNGHIHILEIAAQRASTDITTLRKLSVDRHWQGEHPTF